LIVVSFSCDWCPSGTLPFPRSAFQAAWLTRESPPFTAGSSHWRKRPTSSLSRYPKTVCGSAVTALRKMIQTRSFHRPALYVAIACASSALIGRAARLKDYGRPHSIPPRAEPRALGLPQHSSSGRSPVGHKPKPAQSLLYDLLTRIDRKSPRLYRETWACGPTC